MTRTMSTLFRWSAPLVLAAGFAAAALAPSTARAQSGDHLARVIVDIADVIYRGDTAYDRRGRYGPDDRLIVSRDRYGRVVYYRHDPRYSRSGPPYGNAYGYHGKAPGQQKHKHKHKRKGHDRYYDSRRGDRYDRRHDDRYSSRYRDDDRRRDRRRDDRRR